MDTGIRLGMGGGGGGAAEGGAGGGGGRGWADEEEGVVSDSAVIKRMRDLQPLIDEVVGKVWPGLKDGAAWISAQVYTESLGDPRAVSHVGAQGLLQLMPSTALEIGVLDPFDPRSNLTGGVTYLHRAFGQLF